LTHKANVGLATPFARVISETNNWIS